MNTTQYKRWSQNGHPRRKHFLTALLVAVMVMISTVPAFAAETTANASVPDTEVSVSAPDLVEDPGDEDGTLQAPTTGPVSTIEGLLEAIAHASKDDVIEIDAIIETPVELVLGRADCPVTIRRTTSEARLMLGKSEAGSIKVQNITFDGAEIQSKFPIITTSSPTQIFEKCNFVNCISYYSGALEITQGETFISDCHFSNNIGELGAHFRTDGRKATIVNCTFTGGYAVYKGPVFIMTIEETLMIGCTVSGNTAGEQGGGIYVGRGALSIAESKIYGNTANGVADDITEDYWSRLSLADDYAALVELYKPDGVTPNRWTVDSRSNGAYEMDFYHANMVFSMTFADSEPSPPPVLASITLNKSELALYVGETDTLTATLHPEGISSSIQWTSSDPAVASVTEGGRVTANSAGTALITATAADSGVSASCRVNVQSVFIVPAKTYSIDISASPVEGGVVSGNGQYEEGMTATVTVVPNEDFRFLAWMEADAQISTESSLTFTVSNDRTLTAIFEPISEPVPGPIPKPTYTISTSATVGGTVSGAGQYEQGSSVILTATPESGYLFVGWTENDKRISTDESFTFIADCDRTFIANFAPITQPTYTINVSATAGGTASGGGEYEQGSSVTLTAIPESEYLFAGWTENGEQVSTNESFTFAADRDRTLVANFAPIPTPLYTVQVHSTKGGDVEGGGSYEEGEPVTVNAVPDAGYCFLHWEENGVQVCMEAQYFFTAEADRTLIAIFDLLPQSITDLTYEPPYDPGTPTTHGPRSNNAQPVVTSVSPPKEVQIPKLMNGKAVLIAPDDSFWAGYKTGRDNGTETVTRADLAQLVYSVMDDESRKIYSMAQSPFRDVEQGVWYKAAVETMLDTGIMVGCGNGLFCPDRTLTWGELLTVFARFAEDNPITEYYTGQHWAKSAVNKAFALGWLEYTEVFDPGRAVTTGEMVDLVQAVFRWNSE